MENTSSMKYNRDFRYLYKKGKSVAGSYLVIYAKKAGKKENILGITVTKKLGNAVVRNRVRRLIRECYRLREREIKVGYKIVIVARGRAANADFYAIKNDMGYLLGKIGLVGADDVKGTGGDGSKDVGL